MLAKVVNLLAFGLAVTSSVSALPSAHNAPSGSFTRDAVATNDNVDATLSRRGLKIETFHTGKMEFKTDQGAIWGPPYDDSDDSTGAYSARITDCEKLQAEMVEMAGYWVISNFVFEGDGTLGRPLDLYTVGSCTVLVKAYYKDYPLVLGSGDVYAWIQTSIERYQKADTTGAYGNMTYNNNEYGWIIA